VGGLVFLLAMIASAYVAVPVPWSPVPMTLQPMVALMAGAILGPAAGAASMATYVALGATGLPVFAAGGAGLPWLVGPTGGYLMAFPVAALLVGAIAPRGAGMSRLVAGLVAGLAAIYAGGLTQLAVLSGLGWGDLVAVGVLPFLGGDVIKVLLALVIIRALRASSLGRR
jgi:biotin transport system substrate-specific component